MSYFIFNNIDSRNYGILEKLPLDIRAERTTQIIDMPYGTPVVYQSQAYKSQKITVNLGLKDNSAANLSAINQWLQGYHELIFSDDLTKHYMAVCNGVLNGERMVRNLGKIPITFTVMPFKYDNTHDYETFTATSLNTQSNIVTIPYSGTAPSEPLFKIYGSGDFAWDIDNGKTWMKFYDITDYVIVDVENRKVLNKSGQMINNNTEIRGSFFNLCMHDGFRIVVDKPVTRIDIDKKTRWL